MKAIKFQLPEYLAIPASPDDLIQIESFSSSNPVDLICEGVAMNKDGDIVPFLFNFTVSLNLTLETFRFRLGYNFLISIVIHTRTSGIPDGSCYLRLTLVQEETGGVFPHRKLLSQGYISQFASIGYGSAAITGLPREHFFIQNIEIADPGAGNEINFICPGFTSLEIISFRFTFTTSAAVATRLCSLVVSMPPGQPHNFPAYTAQTAGLNIDYTFFENADPANTILATQELGNIPRLILQPGCVLETLTNNFVGADQYTSISLLVKRQTIPF